MWTPIYKKEVGQGFPLYYYFYKRLKTKKHLIEFEHFSLLEPHNIIWTSLCDTLSKLKKYPE